MSPFLETLVKQVVDAAILGGWGAFTSISAILASGSANEKSLCIAAVVSFGSAFFYKLVVVRGLGGK